MYCEYFGLKEPPFSIAPNPDYLYMSPRHQDALAHLLYGIQSQGGFMLLTGEVGTGKTTLCRSLLEQIPDNTHVAFILNPYLSTNELLQAICKELGIVFRQSNASLRQLTELIYRFLLDNHSKGRNTVLIIDEAQHLQFKTLELIRLLTNLETNTKKLLQIVFIGQPELNTLLAQPKLRQLSQRITARFHIEPLSADETYAYICHRLKVGGLAGHQSMFSRPIVKRIHTMTSGIPRLINVLCDRALLGTFVQNKTMIDKPTLEKSLIEIKGESTSKKRRVWPYAIAVVIGLALWFILMWLLTEPDKTAITPTPKALPIDSELINSVPQNKAIEPVTIDVADPKTSGFDSKFTALSQLINKGYGLTITSDDPCQSAKLEGLACEEDTLTSWQAFKTINRPSVLELNIEADTYYLAILSIEGGVARVLTEGKRVKKIPLLSIGEYWQGKLTYVWRKPPGFESTLTEGAQSPAVRWVADAFQLLDTQLLKGETPERLADDTFTKALAKRVSIFQRSVGLKESGELTLMTLLRLNEVLGRAVVLSQRSVAATPRESIEESR